MPARNIGHQLQSNCSVLRCIRQDKMPRSGRVTADGSHRETLNKHWRDIVLLIQTLQAPEILLYSKKDKNVKGWKHTTVNMSEWKANAELGNHLKSEEIATHSTTSGSLPPQ